MGSAIGNSSSAKDHGNRVFDVRDFGAIPNVISTPVATANTTAFQLAYDTAVAAVGANEYATVYVPAGDWYQIGPIFLDGNKVGFRGEGAGVTNIYNGYQHDIFVVGLSRAPGGHTPSLDHFPDAWTGGPGGTPIYDSSALTAAGQKWGLRTKGDHHVAQHGGPLDRGMGDGYRSMRQITIAMYIDFTLSPTTIPPGLSASTFPTSGSVLGALNQFAGAPFAIYIGSGYINLNFTTTDVNGLNPVTRSFGIYQFPSTPGLVKLDVQIDLVNAQVSTYVNGVQWSPGVNSAIVPASFTPAAGLYFATNTIAPFGVGSTNLGILGVSNIFGGPIDCTFWGLKLTNGLIYNNHNTAGTNDNAGMGVTQTRIDGATITDNQRYFTKESSNTFARLALTNPPSAIAANRLVTVLTNVDIPSTAFFADNHYTGDPDYSSSAGPIEGFGLFCGNPNYGRCVSLCVPNDVRISNCRLYGGSNAIGAILSSTNYPTYIDNCVLTATDACIFLGNAPFVRITQCSFISGISAMRFYYCNAWIYQCFLSFENSYDYCVEALQSNLYVSNLAQDAEGPDGGPTKAMVYISGNAGLDVTAMGSTSHLEYLGGGRQKPGSSIVILDDGGVIEDGAGIRSCRFSMTHLDVEDNYATTILTNNGKRWYGTVTADITPQRPTWIQNNDPSGQGHVISIHDQFIGVPRDGTWGVNAHQLNPTTPAPAQFTQWRCTATGSYGTATPPVWYGMNPIDDGLSLAAYLQANTYWTAPSMPAGGMGFWANGPACLFLNALFGGAMPATPPGLYVGCACRHATRGINYIIEMSGGGYARAATGAWTLTGAGASNATTITFPTATANWNALGFYNVLNSLVFYTTATGSNYVAAVDIPPTTILSGQTLTYAAGSLTLGRGASSVGASALADSIHAKMNGLWLNQAAFTAPAIYLALSTAPASLSAPVEPSGGGYARVATTVANWSINPQAVYGLMGPLATTGIVTNVTALTFPAPTAGWGIVQSVYLMDAPSGGNVLGSANLAVPRTIASGSPARSFAIGAFWLSLS